MSWPTVTLSSLITEARSGFASGESLRDGLAQVRMNNLTTDGKLNWSKLRRVPPPKNYADLILIPGDILFNATNSPELVGKSAFFPGLSEPITFSNHFLRIRSDVSKLDPKYLAHWLVRQFQLGVFRGLCKQWVNQATVSRDSLLALAIPLPPLDEQRRIAAILDKAEQLRAKRCAATELLCKLPAIRFHEMFGDLVANEREWPQVSINDFVERFESGKSLAGNDDDDQDAPYRVLKVSAVTSLVFRPEESKPLPREYRPPYSHRIRKGDLLFSRANTSELIGATSYVWHDYPGLVLSDKLWRFVWRTDRSVDTQFVRHLFQQQKFRKEISQRSSGTSGSMKNISQEKVLTIRCGLPPISLQTAFGRFVQATEELRRLSLLSAQKTDAMFLSLQDTLFREN